MNYNGELKIGKGKRRARVPAGYGGGGGGYFFVNNFEHKDVAVVKKAKCFDCSTTFKI